VYTRTEANSAIWQLGGGGLWLMKDYPNQPKVPFVKDYNVRKFIREKNPSIPVPESFKFQGPDNKFTFEVMARAKGISMGDALEKISNKQERVALYKEVGEHMKQWRQITSPRMGSVDGSTLYDGLIGNCSGSGCIKTGLNEDEWLENLTLAIRKGLLFSKYFKKKGWKQSKEVLDSWAREADEELTELKSKFPRGGPYVLTHCDLHLDNIFVSDDNEDKAWKVSSIID
jgi:hypothetical protein